MKLPMLDAYTIHARLIPGLTFILPVPVVVVALGLRQNPVVAMLVSLIPVIGGPVALSDYVRQRGLAVQERLYADWGGSPTTAALRHRGNPNETAERERLRAHVSKVLTMALPSDAEEMDDPGQADAAYEVAISRLRGLTRNKADFPLLFEENRNYGYSRNLLGMRKPAIVLGGVGVAALAVTSLLSARRAISIPVSNPLVGGLAIGLLLIFWLIVPGPERVRRLAGTYAERLFEASWTLGSRESKSKGSNKKRTGMPKRGS